MSIRMYYVKFNIEYNIFNNELAIYKNVKMTLEKFFINV